MYIRELVSQTIFAILLFGVFLFNFFQIMVLKRYYLKDIGWKDLSEIKALSKVGIFIFLIFILGLGTILAIEDRPYMKDFKAYRNSELQLVEKGEIESLTHIKKSKGGSYDLITIDKKEYKIESALGLMVGDNISVTYLPNTKIILSYENNTKK